MRKLMLVLAAASLVPLAAPAAADPPPWAPAHGKRAKDGWYPEKHYKSGAQYKTRYLSSNDVIYRGGDGRYYCKRDDGTAGLIIGAVAGGVLGHEIAPGGSETVGAILGAVAGGLIGKEIDDDDRPKCR